MGSRSSDNVWIGIPGPADEGLIGANLKCTSQKHFPWRTHNSISASLAERGRLPAHWQLLQGSQRNDMYMDPTENIKIINETNNAKRVREISSPF